jgi:hypothetical protein
MFIYAARAYADFYPVHPITYSGVIVAPRMGWQETIGQRDKPQFAPMHVENVGVASQYLRITFRDSDTVEVESDYILNVYENNVSVEVQYIFSSYDYFLEGETYYVRGIEGFAVELRGRAVDPDEISYYVIDPEPGYPGYYTAVFPFNFSRAGDYKVKLSYSYKVPGGFTAVKDGAIERGSRYGFSYDISPLRYWAGGVDEVRVEVIIDGFNITDFGFIYPSDFVFTLKGCTWEWHDLTDNMLSTRKIDSCFGKPGSLYGDFTNILNEKGMEVYDYPIPKAKVIKTLEKGERIYLYVDSDDPNMSDAVYERGWRKCRLLDNREGYVITWLPEYFFESIERRKIMGDFPGIYGGEKLR